MEDACGDTSIEVKEMRLEGTMTEDGGIEPTPGDAAAASVEHCIITFRKGPSRIRTAGRSASHLLVVCHA